MMKMLKVTDTSGCTIYINPAYLMCFYRYSGGSTAVNMDGDRLKWYVKETPEQIVKMLANCTAMEAARERKKASYQEAIETLKANYPDARYTQLREAVDTAISALERVEMLDELELDKLERCGLKEQSND